MRKLFLLLVSHGVALMIGFAAGIYVLPILVEPEGPSEAEIAQSSSSASYKAVIREDLEGHDFVHWGRGEFAIGSQSIALMGEVAPGPDYKLYLTPRFVETEAEFEAIKAQSRRIGDVKTFTNFLVSVPADVNIDDYSSVVVWCERFGEFITAAEYRAAQ